MPAAALAAASLLAVLSLAPPASAAKRSKPSVREFTGTVVSVRAKQKTFRLRRSGRPSVVVRLSRKTKVAKGARPRKGRVLVVKARRVKKKGWVARSVKLVPVVADDDQTAPGDPVDDEPVAGDEDEDLDDLEEIVGDLDDDVGDLLGDDDGADEEPE